MQAPVAGDAGGAAALISCVDGFVIHVVLRCMRRMRAAPATGAFGEALREAGVAEC